MHEDAQGGGELERDGVSGGMAGGTSSAANSGAAHGAGSLSLPESSPQQPTADMGSTSRADEQAAASADLPHVEKSDIADNGIAKSDARDDRVPECSTEPTSTLRDTSIRCDASLRMETRELRSHDPDSAKLAGMEADLSTAPRDQTNPRREPVTESRDTPKSSSDQTSSDQTSSGQTSRGQCSRDQHPNDPPSSNQPSGARPERANGPSDRRARKPRSRTSRDATVRAEHPVMFRMPTLSHFQSYSRIPQVLEQCVLDALASRRRLDHTLIHGHAGTGKWLLAQALVRDYAPTQAIELDARRGSCPEALWHCIQIVGNGGILVIRHIDKLDPMSERLLEVTLDPRLRTPDAPIPSALRMIMQRTNPYSRRAKDIDRALEEMRELESDDEEPSAPDSELDAERDSRNDSGPEGSHGRGPNGSEDAPDADTDSDGDPDFDTDEALARRRRASRRAALGMQGLPAPTSDEHRRRLDRTWRRVPAFTLVATSEDCDSVDDALLQRFERRTHLRNDPKALRTVLIRALQAKGVTLAPDALPLAERVLASVVDGTEPLVRAIVTRAAIEDADRIDAELFRSIAHEDLADILPTESFARSLLLLHPPQRLARADDAAIDAMAERHCWSPSTVRSAVLTIHRLSWVEQVNASIAASFEIETKKPTPPMARPIDGEPAQQERASNASGEVSPASPEPSEGPTTPVGEVSTRVVSTPVISTPSLSTPEVSTPVTPATVATPASPSTSATPTTPASSAEIGAMEPSSRSIDTTAPTNLEAECPAPTVHARDPLGAHDPTTSDGPGPNADLAPRDRDDLVA